MMMKRGMKRGMLLFVCLLPMSAFADGWGGSTGDIVTKSDPHKDKIDSFMQWVKSAKEDGGRHGAALFKACIGSYDLAIEAGVPPTQPIDEDGFKGTMEEIRKSVCEAGKGTADAKADAFYAPYKKVLKNDKFDTWKDYRAAIMLPGGADAGVPANLAKASHWYVDVSPPEHCANGKQKHRVHDYLFDANQKLKKTTDKDFCGTPPSH